MRIEIDDWPTAIVFILVVLGVLFGLMYSAARLAASEPLNLPKFSCLPEQDGGTTRFVLQNTGTAPAFDVAVRLARDPRGAPLARSPLLGPAATVAWTSTRAAATPGEVPTADQIVEWLTIEWRLVPSGSRRWARMPVRIPKGLIAR